jgi:splicing factor 3A subunit 3
VPFYAFPDRNAVKDDIYKSYVKELWDYLVSFLKRSQPLLDISVPIKQFEEDFEKDWQNKTFTPIGSSDEDDKKDKLFCKECNKVFKSENVYKHHIPGKYHKKAVGIYNTKMKEIWFLEVMINRIVDLLTEQLEDTKGHIQKKQSMGIDEIMLNLEEDDAPEESSSDSSEEEVRMTKANYPVGWDGNPIPYWLYKLHGLGIEYKCEICGNTSYWGRRAYEKHFQEWRHAHGMKCLRLENSKAFHEITRMQDALELDRYLKKTQAKTKWDADNMEEYEDEDGNVLNKKTFVDLKMQGIL